MTRTAAVIVTAAVLTGIGATAASAATPHSGDASAVQSRDQMSQHADQVGHTLYTKGFRVFNMTDRTLRLAAVEGSDPMDGPPIGTLLLPGQSQDFELTWFLFRDASRTLVFDQLDLNGYRLAGQYRMQIKNTQDSPSATDLGHPIGTHTGVVPPSWTQNYTAIEMFNPSGRTTTVDGSNQNAAALLNTICGQNINACTFTVGTETEIPGPFHIVTSDRNTTDETDILTAGKGDDVSYTDSLEVQGGIQVQLTEMVELGIQTTYRHEWTHGKHWDTTLSIQVPPHTLGEITAISPMLRDTGNFSLDWQGNTIKVINTYFDSPDSDAPNGWGHQDTKLG